MSPEEYHESLVSQTLGSCCEHLSRNPHAKFSFSDIAFLKLWVSSTRTATECFRRLVATGQLEILNGGYSQHDNANPYFDDILNNYEYSREFLKQELSVNPRTAWMIDPFGYSITSSRLFAEMGYLQMVTNRIPERERAQMRNSSGLQQFWDVRNISQYTLFFSNLASHYQTPESLDIDYGLGHPSTVMTNTAILDEGFDFADRCVRFFDRVQSFNSWYLNKHFMIPFGGDFWFSNFSRRCSIHNNQRLGRGVSASI